MAATLASLWERKKKVQPNTATVPLDLTVETERTDRAEGFTTCSTAQNSSSGPSCYQSHRKPADVDRVSQGSGCGSGQDRKRKRPDLSAKQVQVLDALHSSSSDPSPEEVNAAARMAGLSEQLVQDLLVQKCKTKVQKGNEHTKAAKTAASAQTGAADDASEEPIMVASLDSPAGEVSTAHAQPADAAHHDPQRLSRPALGQPDAVQQAAHPFTEVRETAAEAHVPDPGPEGQKQPESGQNSRQQMLQQYQAELQSCLQQAGAVQAMAAMPQFADGQLSRPEVCQ